MSISRRQVGLLLSIILLAAILAAGHRRGQAVAPYQPAATCTTPFTETIRGKEVTWDQCYLNEFSHDGDDYAVRVYYTEFFEQSEDDPNYEDCAVDEDDPATRCEHAIADDDDGNGDNIYAVQLGTEVEQALRFYIDQDMAPMPGTDFYVYVAEDPKNGWIKGDDGIITDDEKAETTDELSVRWNVYHEMQHLIQKQFANGNWNLWYTEGLARAIEDRVDPALDAALKAFITDSRRMLRNSESHDFPRSSDILEAKYRAVVWWTWVLDQYRAPAEVEPVTGWLALQDFYDEINTGVDSLTAAANFIQDQGGNFQDDFIDYTLAMYAYKYNPADPRLGFLDAELINETDLENHTIISTPPVGWQPTLVYMNPRSSRYWEFDDASQCDYTGFTFSSNSEPYGYSLLTVDGSTLDGRWTVFGNEWARTVRSVDLERVAGVVTAVDSSGFVALSYGCATPTVSIVDPTTTAFKMVGTANDPRTFIVQLSVTDENAGPVGGLVPDAFSLEIDNGDGPIPANIVSAAYVQDYYWLLVQAPGAADGAQTGEFYDLTVTLDDYDSDTQANALLYVEQTQDRLLVLDRSGSMADNDKLGAAQNAATLMVNELADDDQGGYVAFDQDAYLREGLDGMDVANHRQNLETAIASETPGGQTSIGDGMFLAAEEHDDNGIADNVCSFVLLSDGYENAEAYWADVQADVVDNDCALDVIAFGPEANEDLLQLIAGASAAPASSGFDYAPDSGSITFGTAGGTSTLGWENNLSRIYDYMVTRSAGRQRIFSDGASPSSAGESYKFMVDETTDELVLAIAWQTPLADVIVRLFDPDGNELADTLSRTGSTLTNEVWRVPNPKPGHWTMTVRGAPGEYYVSAGARTDLGIFLLGRGAHTWDGDPDWPIVAAFVNNGQPVLGANVTARVTAPGGGQTLLQLYDDGAHGDSLAGDGIYGNGYPVITTGEVVPEDPKGFAEGEAPASAGSYGVEVVGVWNGHRREAQSSFVVQQAPDGDGDGLPDPYEEAHHGLDPKDPTDGRSDPDGDGLYTLCEFQNGTDPFNGDSDNGGESDGSELPGCKPGSQDPLDPRDDRIGSHRGLLVSAEADREGPFIVLSPLGLTDTEVLSATLYRRLVAMDGEPQPWMFTYMTDTLPTIVDRNIADGQMWQYLIVPEREGRGSTTIYGGGALSRVVAAKDDPYAPDGSIVINGGDLATHTRFVTLSIIADDRSPDHGDLDEAPRPGDGAADLMMRLSNDPDFAGAVWQPYASSVPNWDLGDVQPGEEVTVFVQFMDTSGNLGAGGLGQFDSILYRPGHLYLPLIFK